MRVTLQLDDALAKEARHRAANEGLSFSEWVAKIVKAELSNPSERRQTMIELIGMDDGRDLREFIPDRKTAIERPIEFP